jgi:GTP-binding protein HflX
LFNVLTQAAVLESPRMFATLDPTIRAVMLPSKRKVLLSDTVGFIRNLPHTLVSAFRATLEEVQRAALVIHVSDASSPLSVEQDAQVDRVLKELEVGDKPRLLVMNKIDLLSPTQRESLRDDEVSVHISAAKDIGISTLLERIDEMLSEDAVSRVVLRMPQQEGKLLALLEARSRIYSRNYKDGLVELEVEAPDSIIRRVRDWVVGVST